MIAAYNNRGGIHHDQGNLEAALKDYDRAIALAPEWPMAYNNRGVTRKAKGDLQGALRDYTKALELRPAFALAYANRARVYNELRQYEKARQDIGKSITYGLTMEENVEPTNEKTAIKVTSTKPPKQL